MLTLTSPAFEDNELIPEKHTCDGDNSFPPLEISGTPEETQSLVLIMDDPDAPGGTYTHWIVYNLEPDTTAIREGRLPPEAKVGLNSADTADYVGPCPPSGEHAYHFKLYALDTVPSLPGNADLRQVEEAIAGHVIDQAELVGRYSKS